MKIAIYPAIFYFNPLSPLPSYLSFLLSHLTLRPSQQVAKIGDVALPPLPDPAGGGERWWRWRGAPLPSLPSF